MQLSKKRIQLIATYKKEANSTFGFASFINCNETVNYDDELAVLCFAFDSGEYEHMHGQFRT